MLEIKPYEQTKSGYCGPASLKMVLDFYGIKKTEKDLAKITGASMKEGMAVDGFKKAAEFFNLKIIVKDFADFRDIEFYLKKKIPVIVGWFLIDDGHYSVVVNLDKDYIYLADPEAGKIKKLKRDIFKRVWFDFAGSYLRKKNDIIIRRMIVFYK
jgi:ABC-type bacteriocin/lantibiotic exporter with double-glycine peptidase domain